MQPEEVVVVLTPVLMSVIAFWFVRALRRARKNLMVERFQELQTRYEELANGCANADCLQRLAPIAAEQREIVASMARDEGDPGLADALVDFAGRPRLDAAVERPH